MTNYIFTCKEKEQNEALMNDIWKAARFWEGYESGKIMLCRWHDDDGFHTAFALFDSVGATISFEFSCLDTPEGGYRMILKKEDEKTVIVSRDIEVKVYHEGEERFKNILKKGQE